MKTKKFIANEIIKFFRMFRISSTIGLITIAAMYFGFYQSYKCSNLDLTHTKVVPVYYDDGKYSTETPKYKIDSSLHVRSARELFDEIEEKRERNIYMKPTISPLPHPAYSRIYYGSPFNRRIHNYYYTLTNARATYELKERIEDCCKWWLVDRLIHSALFGLAAFLIIPILFTFIRLIYKALITSKNWINKNKTI